MPPVTHCGGRASFRQEATGQFPRWIEPSGCSEPGGRPETRQAPVESRRRGTYFWCWARHLAQRAFWAAMIRARPSGLIFRRFFGGAGAPALAARHLAHRARAAAAMAARPAALMRRLRRGGTVWTAAAAPPRMPASSASSRSISSRIRKARRSCSTDSFAGVSGIMRRGCNSRAASVKPNSGPPCACYTARPPNLAWSGRRQTTFPNRRARLSGGLPT